MAHVDFSSANVQDSREAAFGCVGAWLTPSPQTVLFGPKMMVRAAIPSLCGYQSLPTFARTFKAATGMTMLSYRKQQQ